MTRSITEAFAHDDDDCSACRGEGMVCANSQQFCEHLGALPPIPDSCCAEGAPCPVFMAEHA